MIDVWDVAAKDAAFQGIGTNPAKARRAVFSAHVCGGRGYSLVYEVLELDPLL